MARVRRNDAFDFDRYDPLDWHQQLRLSMAIHEEGQAAAEEVWKQTQTFKLTLATMALGDAAKDLRGRLLNEAFDARQSLLASLMPWVFDEQPTTKTDGLKDLNQAWADVWGDPNDPAVAQRIQNTVDYLSGG